MTDIILKEEQGGTREPIPAGNHLGICCAIIDLGTADNTWKGETKKRHSINICFELPDHTYELDGETVRKCKSKTETLSFGDKANLRKHLESWRGRKFTAQELQGFSVRNILGKPALVNIAHSDSGKDFIQGISPIMKSMTVPELSVEPYVYSLKSPGENWDRLPGWAKQQIKESDEWPQISQFIPQEEGAPTAPAKAPAQAAVAPTQEEDDCPF